MDHQMAFTAWNTISSIDAEPKLCAFDLSKYCQGNTCMAWRYSESDPHRDPNHARKLNGYCGRVGMVAPEEAQ